MKDTVIPAEGQAPEPWMLKREDVALRLEVDAEAGLSSEEAGARLRSYGPNRMQEAAAEPPWLMFARQFANPLVAILVAGAVISAITGHLIDTIAIGIIVLLNAGISFWQEYQAEQSLAALKEMAAPSAMVKRDGEWTDIPAADIVPGDVLRLKAGDILAADIRLMEANRLQIDEAALTGESEPVDKHERVIEAEDVVLADRLNMGFMSTMVTNGTGTGIVTGTGMETEVGHIANLMATAKEPKTPLQRKIDALSKTLIIAALTVVAVVTGIGVINGMGLDEMLGTAISLSVAAIPEGMPTVVTILLTLGSQKMAQNSALARRLSAVETLGAVSVICSDKTGTLTQNQMQVMRLWAGGKTWTVTGEGFDPNGEFLDREGTAANVEKEDDLRHMLRISAYCNEARIIDNKGKPGIQGNPTEGALVVAGSEGRDQPGRDEGRQHRASAVVPLRFHAEDDERSGPDADGRGSSGGQGGAGCHPVPGQSHQASRRGC